MKDKHVRPIDAALARLRSTYTPGQGRPREDVEEHIDVHAEPDAVPPADQLLWPPPGLEKVHGELWRLSADFAFGALILFLIVVWLGFFAAAPRNAGGWGAFAALAIAALLLVRTYAQLRQFLMYAYMAIGQGYPRRLVWQVAADNARDTALLLQASGYYTGITKHEIAQMSDSRITAAALALFGTLWVPLVFPFVAVLGFLGVLSDTVAWLVLLAPATLLLLASTYLRYQEWRARQKFRAREVLEREVAAQASAWTQLLAALGMRRPRSKNTTELKLAMGAVWLAAFILLIPLALAFITTAIPRFMTSYALVLPARFHALQMLQSKRTPADSTVTEIQAGRALQTLLFVGQDPALARPLMQPPSRRYPAVFAISQFTPAMNPYFWSDSLFGWIKRNALTAEQRTMIQTAARHPAAREFALLAAARRIDIPGTRWHLDAADTAGVGALPYVSARSIREVAQARIAAAGLAFERGGIAEAEAAIGEVISVGFLLRDEAPTMSDAVTGASLLRMGGGSLAALYDESGRIREAAQIRAMAGLADREPVASRGARSLEAVYEYVLNHRNARAARWEVFATLQTAAPCLSLYAGMFGPTKEHKEWVEVARRTLVRTPSEAQYFRVIEQGIASNKRGDDARCSLRVLRTFRPLLTGY